MKAGDEGGVALAFTLFAMMIVGALVTTALLVGVWEQRLGSNTIRLHQALAAAEYGANRRLVEWEPFETNQLAIGDSLEFGGALPGTGGWYRGWVVRTGSTLFLVRAEGFAADSVARQSVGVLSRLDPPGIEFLAGFTTHVLPALDGGATISGVDVVPAAWAGRPLLPGCAIGGDTVPGIRVIRYRDAGVQPDPAALEAYAVGDPPVIIDSAASADDAVPSFWLGELESGATKTLAAGTHSQLQPRASGGSCATSVITNWGDPVGAVPECRSYFPHLFVAGDLVIEGGRGQGILTVAGDLTIRGRFDFYGPVIVGETVSIVGEGGDTARIYGALVAFGTTGEPSRISGSTLVQYSSCSIGAAMAGGSRAESLFERSWVRIY